MAKRTAVPAAIARAGDGKGPHICSECGHEEHGWRGQCPECESWDTMRPAPIITSLTDRKAHVPRDGTWVSAGKPRKITEIDVGAIERIPTGIGELDRVLGTTGKVSGMVPGGMYLLSGDPGSGGNAPTLAQGRLLDVGTGALIGLDDGCPGLSTLLALDETSLCLCPQSVHGLSQRLMHEPILLTTHMGRKLIADRADKVMTGYGWRPIGALHAGDRIAAARSLPVFGRARMFDHEVKFLAYMVSDGHTASSTSITTAMPEVAEDIQEVAAWFNLSVRVSHKKGCRAKTYFLVRDRVLRADLRRQVGGAITRECRKAGRTVQQAAAVAGIPGWRASLWLNGHGTPTREELEALADVLGIHVMLLCPDFAAVAGEKSPVAALLEDTGLRHTKAADKFVPAYIFQLPTEQIALFVRTLFTCDGSVFVNAGGAPGLSYSTISRRLAEDVQHLLLRFGIVTRIRTKRMPTVRPDYVAYEVVGSGVCMVRRFLHEIGILGREEAKAAIAARPTPSLPSTGRDTVPIGPWFWDHLLDVSGCRTIKAAARQAGVALHPERPNGPLTRKTMRKLACSYPSREIVRLADNDVYWDDVASIDPLPSPAILAQPLLSGADNWLVNDLILRPAPS